MRDFTGIYQSNPRTSYEQKLLFFTPEQLFGTDATALNRLVANGAAGGGAGGAGGAHAALAGSVDVRVPARTASHAAPALKRQRLATAEDSEQELK